MFVHTGKRTIVMRIRDLVLVKGSDGPPRMKSCFL
jgi:hypothetical protein